eukprot:2235661-Prymnesium_polylepis.1
MPWKNPRLPVDIPTNGRMPKHQSRRGVKHMRCADRQRETSSADPQHTRRAPSVAGWPMVTPGGGVGRYAAL